MTTHIIILIWQAVFYWGPDGSGRRFGIQRANGFNCPPILEMVDGVFAAAGLTFTLDGITLATRIADGQMVLGKPVVSKHDGNIRVLDRIPLDDPPNSLREAFRLVHKAGDEIKLQCCEICGMPGPASVMCETTLPDQASLPAHHAPVYPWFSSVATSLRVWYCKPMLQKRLGQRIAGLRKTRRLTQARLAKAVGCSVEFISLVERGVNAPSVARLEDFAKALEVEVVDLFKFAVRKPTRIKRRRISLRSA